MGFTKKSIVCDSSALISLADSCFLPALADLRRYLGADFLISESVKYECIDHPLKLKSHTLPAIRLQLALNDGIIKVADSKNLRRRTDDLLWVANNIFFSHESPVQVMHKGETETLALALELGLTNVLIDERTARVLIEKPDMMCHHLEEELHRNIKINGKYLDRFNQMTSGLTLFRSSELIIMAYEHGYFKKFKDLEKQAVEAALYGLKFVGCSISFEEIEDYTKSIQ